MIRVVLCFALVLSTVSAMTPEERRQYRDKLLQILPAAPSFQQWLDKTGELPPDFDALPRVNSLPDPLKFLDGRPVRTAKDWQARRAEIRQLHERYTLGTFPPKPKLDRDANVAQVRSAVEQARKVYSLYGAAERLAIHEPWDYNRLPNATQDWIVHWMARR